MWYASEYDNVGRTSSTSEPGKKENEKGRLCPNVTIVTFQFVTSHRTSKLKNFSGITALEESFIIRADAILSQGMIDGGTKYVRIA